MVILGLGSNIGDRHHYLSEAVHIISKSVLTAIQVSHIYESPALLKPGSPNSWNKPFLNMAILGETHLSPEEMLKSIKMIERNLGRHEIGTWAPREIDIDILAYGDLTVKSDELTIPHKDLCNRPFALLPLADIAPNWQYPGEGEFKGKTAYQISHKFSNDVSTFTRLEEKIPLSGELVA